MSSQPDAVIEERAPSAFPFPERLPPGAVLGDRYAITGFLNRGGFGDVYQGIQMDTGVEIALKILRPVGDAAMQEELERRFVQDALAAARIRHPNVVKILACHDTMSLRLPDGPSADFTRAYFVMELLYGQGLERELSEHGPMDPARALKLVTCCLEGLSEGHRQKIIHKDLKPENLFLAHPGKLAEALVILDFGVARVLDSLGGRLTQPGSAICTPEYTPPEYFESGLVTPSLDVYQMGLILVEMLIGKPLIQGRPFECIRIHEEGVKLPEGLMAGALGPVLRKAVARDVEARYDDAADFCQALLQIDPERVWPTEEITELDDVEVVSVTENPESSSLDDAEQGAADGSEDGAAAAKPELAIPEVFANSEPTPSPAPVLPPRTQPSILWWAIAGAAAMVLMAVGVLLGAAMGSASSDAEVEQGQADCSSTAQCIKEAMAASERGDAKAAMGFYDRGCKLGDTSSCTALATALDAGGDASDQSLHALRRACAGGDGPGCRLLAQRFEQGKGVRKSQPFAMELYLSGCDAKDMPSCMALGHFYEAEKVFKKAFEFYEMSCDGGEQRGCTDMGRMFEQNRGFMRKDMERAVELHKSSCDAGEPRGCANMGRLHERSLIEGAATKDALSYYGKACDAKDAQGCLGLAGMTERGDGVTASPMKALGLYETACEGGAAHACRQHKRLLRQLGSDE